MATFRPVDYDPFAAPTVGVGGEPSFQTIAPGVRERFDAPALPGEFGSLKSRAPSSRDNVAAALIEAGLPPAAAGKITGSRGAGASELGVADLTPVGAAWGLEEGLREDASNTDLALGIAGALPLPAAGAVKRGAKAAVEVASDALGAGGKAARKVPFPQVDEIPAAVRQTPKGGGPLPELAERYPEVGDPGLFDKATMKPVVEGRVPDWRERKPPEGAYYGNMPTEEEQALSKELKKAQKRINEGDYEPFFDVGARTDVDKSKYPARARTVEERVPKTKKAIESYAAQTSDPAKAKRLIEAYKAGITDPGAKDWYFMGQLEEQFIKEYGEVGGRKMFQRKFADQMAATTGGSTPTDNFRNAMYANYQQARGLKASPEASHQLPHPIGGRYVGGNMEMADKMAAEGLTTDNPKRYNFSGNFTGDEQAVTLDEQMSMILGHSKKAFNGPEYGPYEKLVQEVARELGVTPRELQEVAWSGYKSTAGGGKGKRAKPMIEIVNEAIERTAAVTGLSPEEVVRRGIVRSEIPVYGLSAPLAVGGTAAIVAGEDEPPPDNDLMRTPNWQTPEYNALVQSGSGA